jgi:ACR3 family arsenite transporter
LRRRPIELDRRQQFLRARSRHGISLFGFHSGAALATVVGGLIEVPVMLLVVGIVNRSQRWYESAGSSIQRRS